MKFGAIVEVGFGHSPWPLSCSQLGARSPRHFTVGLDRVLLRFAAGDHARRNPMTLVASRVGPCQAHAAERKLVFTASRGRESSACVWEPGPYSSTSLKCSQHFAFLLSPMMHAFSCSGDLGGHLEWGAGSHPLVLGTGRFSKGSFPIINQNLRMSKTIL